MTGACLGLQGIVAFEQHFTQAEMRSVLENRHDDATIFVKTNVGTPAVRK